MKNGRKVLTIQTAIYPLEAIYGACYSLMDRAYFALEGDPRSKVRVSIRAKADPAPKGADLADQFLEELLHHAIRQKTVQSNQKIRDYIITQALVSAQPASELTPEKVGPLKKEADAGIDQDLEQEIEKLLSEVEKQGSQDDPLAIAVPWEEKFAKPKKAKGKAKEAEEKVEEVRKDEGIRKVAEKQKETEQADADLKKDLEKLLEKSDDTEVQPGAVPASGDRADG